MSKKKKILKLYEGKIMKVFQDNKNKTYNYKQISSVLNITNKKNKNDIIKILRKLFTAKRISKEKEGSYKFMEIDSFYQEGIIEITSGGNGYLLRSENDIFIAKKNLNKALNNDHVRVYVYRKKEKKNKTSGEVEKIIKRAKHEYVGVIEKRKDYAFVLTRGPKMYTDIFISTKEAAKVKDGEKVVVKIEEWPERAPSPFGKIKKVLGSPGDIDVEMYSILYDYGISYNFSKEILEKTKNLETKILKDEIIKRKDFREVLTFTIDPKNAKDFDDAISFREKKEGIIEIGVHIADVSHYVKEGDIIDKEAYKRATSVYLVDRVIPMLPEILSNKLCSLRANEEKYTFSAVFQINKKTNIISEWFGKTIISSNYRFTYEEVQHIIETNKNIVDKKVALNNETYLLPDNVFKAIISLNKIAKTLRKKRKEIGGIYFDRDEVAFELNEKKDPKNIIIKKSKESNKLVEEFMLLANKKVGSFINNKKPIKSFVYRVHDQPDEEKLINLKEIAKSLNYNLDLSKNSLHKNINNLLDSVKGKPEQNMIETLTLRCMAKATYSTNNIGHYGLSFETYSHFTSPIRRYPDLILHRLLFKYLNGENTFNKEILEEKCIHSSYREQLAVKAERDSIKYMQIKYMEDKIGKKYKGTISGITERGIYIEINENKCEGMISIKDIEGDHYSYNPLKHELEGYIKGKIFKLGDSLDIIVKRVDAINRHLDLNIVN